MKVPFARVHSFPRHPLGRHPFVRSAVSSFRNRITTFLYFTRCNYHQKMTVAPKYFFLKCGKVSNASTVLQYQNRKVLCQHSDRDGSRPSGHQHSGDRTYIHEQANGHELHRKAQMHQRLNTMIVFPQYRAGEHAHNHRVQQRAHDPQLVGVHRWESGEWRRRGGKTTATKSIHH